MSDNQTLFDMMDIPYHEWFANVVGGWVYKYGRLNLDHLPFAVIGKTANTFSVVVMTQPFT